MRPSGTCESATRRLQDMWGAVVPWCTLPVAPVQEVWAGAGHLRGDHECGAAGYTDEQVVLCDGARCPDAAEPTGEDRLWLFMVPWLLAMPLAYQVEAGR